MDQLKAGLEGAWGKSQTGAHRALGDHVWMTIPEPAEVGRIMQGREQEGGESIVNTTYVPILFRPW